MSTDRMSKYKATPMATVQSSDTAAKQATATGGAKQRAETHAIEEGDNIFRIYPAHIPDKEPNLQDPYEAMFASFAVPCCKVFLPAWLTEKEADGKPKKDSQGNEIKKKGQKPIFNSRIHGNTLKDAVEETIKMCKAYADANIKDKNEKERFLNKVYGVYNDNPAYRLPGMKYQTTYIMYADKIVGEARKFDRLEIKPTVKDRLNSIATSENSEQPMGTDPFTDPNEGLPIKINYDKSRKTNAYVTDIYKKTEKKNIPGHGLVDVVVKFPLTEANLEAFEKYPPLAASFKNAFRRRDFDLQVEGLMMFDEDNKLGFTSWPEWLSMIEEIDAYYPTKEEEDAKAAEESGGNTGDPFEEEKTAEETGDGLDLMNRKDLVQYIATHKLGIVVKPVMKEDAIRERIRESMAAGALSVEETKKPVTAVDQKLPNEAGFDAQEKKNAEEKKEGTMTAAQARLAEIRNRNKK